jgi:hypothetical protein
LFGNTNIPGGEMKLISFLFFVVYSSQVYADSIGLRGGGDAAVAEFNNITSAWATVNYDGLLRPGYDELLNLISTVPVRTISYDPVMTFYDGKIYLDFSSWNQLSYRQKLHKIVWQYLQILKNEKFVTLGVQAHVRLLAQQICRIDLAHCHDLNSRPPLKVAGKEFTKIAADLFTILASSTTGTEKEIVKMVQSVKSDVRIYFSDEKLVLKEREVDAINDRANKSITVNRPRWKLLTDSQKIKLVIHEFIAVAGVKDDDFYWTFQLYYTLSERSHFNPDTSFTEHVRSDKVGTFH